MTWDFLVNPLVTLLTLFYSVLGNNIVLAIALLTVIIRLATSPLLIQQQRSAAAMQEVQPKLKKIQEQYKNDREKLSQEQMKLYQEHGINPLGGCLPLVVQLPILFALYATITHALAATPYQLIDNAGRLLMPNLESLVPLNKIWLNMDLTQAPTIQTSVAPWALALPLLVLITTWLQSKLTIPTSQPNPDGKPNQAEMMSRQMTTIMPIMFGFFALNFPIGMSIYFIVGNLVGIAQYTMMGKADWRGLLGLPPAPKPEPALVSGSPKNLVAGAGDGDMIEAVAGKAKSGNRPNGNKNASASREVLKTTPDTSLAEDSGGKNKNRKKK
ncbi:MAG TPA: YidC/Oxa1 family membrane protein insertase, partial [Phototrophicaceae bacterium]|jgi:YidC/Oxa1 family membrane protein insertase|nr:YidC/Oxa1 family membrane protein insertase [Phototrophicaceae bacterium]